MLSLKINKNFKSDNYNKKYKYNIFFYNSGSLDLNRQHYFIVSWDLVTDIVATCEL